MLAVPESSSTPCCGGESSCAAPADPVDSAGAGDSFAGAFLAYWLETNDLHLAANRSAMVAAGTVSGLGAVEPIPRRADILTD